MAEILQRYAVAGTGAWYAQVRFTDGTRQELKIRAESEPSDAEFLALAEEIAAANAAAQEMTFEVEAEDGTII